MTAEPELSLGRYTVFGPIGRGGMAVVHLGRLAGPLGFSRAVAVKRIHPHLARDANAMAMFVDEARLASRVQHPNTVAMLDVLHENGQLFLVMELVLGQALAGLLAECRRRGRTVPIPIAARIIVDVLGGLQAAHAATDARGQPLDLIHRDVSPHNILVGVDGLARVADFGIAKASVRLAKTMDGRVKGKVRYMAPEQLTGGDITHLVDIYAAGVTLWELLAGSKRFELEADDAALRDPERVVPAPSSVNPAVPADLDQIVARALDNVPERRFVDALAMATAVESAIRCASANEVASWVADVGAEHVSELRNALREIEQAAPVQSMSPSLQLLIPELSPKPTESAPDYLDEVKTTLYRSPAAEYTEAGTEIIRPVPDLAPVEDEGELATAVSPMAAPEPPTTVRRVPAERASTLSAFVAGGLVVLVTLLLLAAIYKCASE